MINKLYKLKQSQLNQKLILKQQLISKKNDVQNQLNKINSELLTAGVQKFGAIGDFKILAIHKKHMKYQKSLLEKDINMLDEEINRYEKVIIEHQKEVEKYNYLIKEQLKQKLKQIKKDEEMVSSEYVLSKYARVS